MSRRFILVRDDCDGINEPGVVAEGVLFTCGKATLNWTTKPHSVQVFDTMNEVINIQRRNNMTRIQWVDSEVRDPERPRPSGLYKLQALQGRVSELMSVVSMGDDLVLVGVPRSSR
jgi:hypothetical protein